jgi:acyl carrier protein
VVTGKEVSNENLVPRQDIGKPTCNNEIYIFGKNLDLLPIGIIGEIFIGGQSVGPGYINNEPENKKRFIKHNIYGRLYKTGDLALRDFDGNIHYIGRSDDQVKINGIRIELDEIIKAIKLNQNVTNAIAIIVEVKPNVKQICAFYTGNLADREMRNFLIDQIPTYYMPAIIMKLDEMPLNANGKIDKNYLRTMVNESNTFEVIKPKSWLQQELINILSEITHLDTDKIGINFSFYDLGLTSLQFINLVSEINSKYKMAFSIKDIIEANTISGLFSLIMQPNNHSNSLLFSLTGKLDGSKPLLVLFPAYFGEGLYYLELANYLNNNYNVLSCNYYSLEEEQFDTDLFSRKVSKEIDLLGFENVILGGASYGFRVAYRVAFYSTIKIKEILNFDGSVYNDLEDEIETIFKINNYELSNYEGIDKKARLKSLDNYISNERKIKYINDYYIGTLNGIDIINFYPENSAVSNFSRFDLTNANIIDVTIEGNHENMLVLKNNHKTIKNQLNK